MKSSKNPATDTKQRAAYQSMTQSELRLEFYTVANEPNPTGAPRISWRLRRGPGKRGCVLLYSAERWSSLATARQQAGQLILELFHNDFEVYDLTRSSAAKTPTVRRRARP